MLFLRKTKTERHFSKAHFILVIKTKNYNYDGLGQLIKTRTKL